MMAVYLKVRFEDDLGERLERRSAYERRPKSEIVNRALKYWMDEFAGFSEIVVPAKPE